MLLGSCWLPLNMHDTNNTLRVLLTRWLLWFKCVTSVRTVGFFHLLEACVPPSGIMEASPQGGGGFQISSRSWAFGLCDRIA